MSKQVITVTMNTAIDKTVTLDQLTPYGLNRVKSIRHDPGGKGVDVGRVLHDFGVDVKVTGLIAGRQGAFLLEQLKKIGIDADFLEVEGETRTNLKVVDESVSKVTEINEPGFYVSPEDADSFLKKLEALSAQAEIIVISGSLPPGIPKDYYARCTEIVKNKGAKVLLDADGAALSEGLKAAPFAVKPNLYELEMLFQEKFGSMPQIADAAKKLNDKGIDIVIVSLGADGALVSNGSEIYKTDCWDVEVRNTVGAGDSMMGALTYSLLKQDSLYDIAKLTTAAGTITVSKSGTRFCTLAEVLESVDRVKVTKL